MSRAAALMLWGALAGTPAAARAQLPWPPPSAPSSSAAESPAKLALDRSLDPPPPPPRVAARVLLGGGAALFLGGLVGAALSPRCVTRDATGGCVDAAGSPAVFPLLMAGGLVVGTVGGYLWRQDAPTEP